MSNLDIFQVGTWPMTVYRVKHEDGSITRFHQSAYVDTEENGGYGPVAIQCLPSGLEAMVDHEVNMRCGGKLSTRWIERFYAGGE